MLLVKKDIELTTPVTGHQGPVMLSVTLDPSFREVKP